MTGGVPAPRSAEGRPTVLRTLSSSVLLDRAGDVELLRETRGSLVEWGGVYAQHVRLTGAWRITIDGPDGAFDLPSTLVTSTVDGEAFRSAHRVGNVDVLQRVVPLAVPAGALRSLTFRFRGAAPVRLTVTSCIAPFLLPVMVEGIRPVDYRLETRADELRVRHRGFAFAFRSSAPPSRLYVDRASWRGGRRRGRLEEVASDHDLVVPPGGSIEVRFAVVGGLERGLDRQDGGAAATLVDPEPVADASTRADAEWLAATPRMSLPDAPELETGYAQARLALRRLYTSPGDGLTGLVAGFPWYSTIWGRDLAWMLPAVLWLGDIEWATASIDSILRFQASTEIDLVGGEAGELPMQVSPGPVFLFGSSDTTLHYPTLAERAVHHSGDPTVARRWQAAIARAIAWGERRTDPATGLLRHGGEVAAVERSAAGLARIRYGIDAPDTTIWDSTDRRDHAIDVQVLWAAALRAASALEERPSGADVRNRLGDLADRVERAIRTRYIWSEEGYLYDSIKEGRPVARVRPNALRAVSAGLLDAGTARAVVRRAAADDLTTPWGVRTLSARDPGYAPTAYHDGQVWTIATAWAADAACAAGEVELGTSYLRTIAARFAAEGGQANECYRGDRIEPFNSCFLLGFSVAPFLTTLFERVWGLAVDARAPRLAVRPAFPAGWRSGTLDGLRVGDGRASLRLRDGRVEVTWRGPRPLEVVGPDGRRTVPGGTTVAVPLP